MRVPTRTAILVDGVVLVHLNLHAALRLELGHDDGISDLLEDRRVSLSPETIVECMKVGSGDDELQVSRLQRSQSARGSVSLAYTHIVGIKC